MYPILPSPSLRRPLVAVATVLVTASLISPAGAQEAAAPASAAADHKRVPVPSMSREADHPFTIEVPVTWEVRRNLPAPGVFLGPPAGDPNSHPEMLLVHESEVALDAPEAILSNLRANAESSGWSLLEAEARDFGGLRGLWVVREMPPSGLHGRRVSYAIKVPLEGRSLDLLATVPVEDQEELAPAIRQMLLSVRAAEPLQPQG